MHIDCEVLELGAVLTDYLVPGGLGLADLRQAAEVIAESEIVGIEIGESFDLDQTSSHGIANWLLMMWGFCQGHRGTTGDPA